MRLPIAIAALVFQHGGQLVQDRELVRIERKARRVGHAIEHRLRVLPPHRSLRVLGANIRTKPSISPLRTR